MGKSTKATYNNQLATQLLKVLQLQNDFINITINNQNYYDNAVNLKYLEARAHIFDINIQYNEQLKILYLSGSKIQIQQFLDETIKSKNLIILPHQITNIEFSDATGALEHIKVYNDNYLSKHPSEPIIHITPESSGTSSIVQIYQNQTLGHEYSNQSEDNTKTLGSIISLRNETFSSYQIPNNALFNLNQEILIEKTITFTDFFPEILLIESNTPANSGSQKAIPESPVIPLEPITLPPQIVDIDTVVTSSTTSIPSNHSVLQNLPPDVINDNLATTLNRSITFSISNIIDNDSDVNGDNITLHQYNTSSSNGGSILDNYDGTYTYTPQTGFSGTDQFSYTVTDGKGGFSTGSVIIEVSSPTTTNLVLRFETVNNTVQKIGNTVTGWQDSAIYNNHLQAFGNPQIGSVFTPSGAEAIAFDSNGDYLLNINPVTGLPGGSADRTMFFVVDYKDSDTWAGFDYGDDDWNQAFGLINIEWSGTYGIHGWGNGNDFASNISTNGDGVGNDEFVVQSVTLSGNQWKHYINGVLIAEGTHTFSTDINPAEASIIMAREIGGYNGEIGLNAAALLLYDTTLSETDRLEVETYLQNAYLKPTTVNTLNGTAGNDFLIGVTSNDTIIADAGDDTIAGNAGIDTITGGLGNDIFDYNYTSDTGVGINQKDVITDFTSGSDRINVEHLANFTIVSANNSSGNGIQDFTSTGIAEIAWQSVVGNIIVMLDLNGDGITDEEIGLNGITQLQHTDFII